MYMKNFIISLWIYAVFYIVATALEVENASAAASCLTLLESAVRNPIKDYYELTTLQTTALELGGTITAILLSLGIVYLVDELIIAII